jgi:hypothetical protein
MASNAHLTLRALAINEEARKSLDECIKMLEKCIESTDARLHQLESLRSLLSY